MNDSSLYDFLTSNRLSNDKMCNWGKIACNWNTPILIHNYAGSTQGHSGDMYVIASDVNTSGVKSWKIFVPTITYPTLAFKPSNLKDIKQVIHWARTECWLQFEVTCDIHTMFLWLINHCVNSLCINEHS